MLRRRIVTKQPIPPNSELTLEQEDERIEIAETEDEGVLTWVTKPGIARGPFDKLNKLDGPKIKRASKALITRQNVRRAQIIAEWLQVEPTVKWPSKQYPPPASTVAQGAANVVYRVSVGTAFLWRIQVVAIRDISADQQLCALPSVLGLEVDEPQILLQTDGGCKRAGLPNAAAGGGIVFGF